MIPSAVTSLSAATFVSSTLGTPFDVVQLFA
jgi:hypothetical protein